MMIRHFADDGLGAVELFEQDNAGEFVGQGHGAEADGFVGGGADGGAESEGTADDKAGNVVGIFGNMLQEDGELLRGHVFAAFVKADDTIVGAEGSH